MPAPNPVRTTLDPFADPSPGFGRSPPPRPSDVSGALGGGSGTDGTLAVAVGMVVSVLVLASVLNRAVFADREMVAR